MTVTNGPTTQSFVYLARETSGCIYFEGLPADAGCHSGKASTESCRKTPAIIRRNLMATPQTLEQESNPWEQQAARFNLAAEKLKLDEGLWRVLQQPNREIIVHIPVAMDNGQLEVFTGYRVQHSIARGPAKGGVSRFSRFERCDAVPGNWLPIQ